MSFGKLRSLILSVWGDVEEMGSGINGLAENKVEKLQLFSGKTLAWSGR
jgi:hypothetical protein